MLEIVEEWLIFFSFNVVDDEWARVTILFFEKVYSTW
jgi:hypothetical protein